MPLTSFNEREGAVTPQAGDYTAEQVGAAAKSHSHNEYAATGHTHSGYASTGHSHSEYAPKESPVFSGTLTEGFGCTASGAYSHAGGLLSEAKGSYSYAIGFQCKTTSAQAYAAGCGAECGNANSLAIGNYVISHIENQIVLGAYNAESWSVADRIIAGKGTSSARANCFRVTDTGVYATGAHNTTGADYAELFEWLDGNPDKADRCGRFVTLDGEKIRLAGPEDVFILGIVSGNPSVVGDIHDDQWQGMYLYDVFGRPLWEDMEVPDPEDPEKTVIQVIISAHTEHRQKLNPDYDGSQPYQPRSQRPEWDAVGMLSKLVAVDDGTCQVNGWCAVGDGGVAAHSEQRTRYRVMARLDETHVRVLIV